MLDRTQSDSKDLTLRSKGQSSILGTSKNYSNTRMITKGKLSSKCFHASILEHIRPSNGQLCMRFIMMRSLKL